MDLCRPADADPATPAKYDNYCALWVAWESLWDLICTPRQEDAAGLKANKVREEATAFTELWVKCFGATKHLYMHLLNAHLPDQIEFFVVDPCEVALQDHEHDHHMTKQDARCHSNGHKVLSKKERGPHTIQTYGKTDGTVVKAHSRPRTSSRVLQLAQTSLERHLQDHFSIVTSRGAQLERERQERGNRRRRRELAHLRTVRSAKWRCAILAPRM